MRQDARKFSADSNINMMSASHFRQLCVQPTLFGLVRFYNIYNIIIIKK